jgi:hypothetical protein
MVHDGTQWHTPLRGPDRSPPHATQVELPDSAAIALMRLHNLPEEYTSPLQHGDVAFVWSPRRDTADITFADRVTTSGPVVKRLEAWREKYQAAAKFTLRVECTNTDQAEGAPLNFDEVYRKLFRQARIVNGVL